MSAPGPSSCPTTPMRPAGAATLGAEGITHTAAHLPKAPSPSPHCSSSSRSRALTASLSFSASTCSCCIAYCAACQRRRARLCSGVARIIMGGSGGGVGGDVRGGGGAWKHGGSLSVAAAAVEAGDPFEATSVTAAPGIRAGGCIDVCAGMPPSPLLCRSSEGGCLC